MPDRNAACACHSSLIAELPVPETPVTLLAGVRGALAAGARSDSRASAIRRPFVLGGLLVVGAAGTAPGSTADITLDLASIAVLPVPSDVGPESAVDDANRFRDDIVGRIEATGRLNVIDSDLV